MLLRNPRAWMALTCTLSLAAGCEEGTGVLKEGASGSSAGVTFGQAPPGPLQEAVIGDVEEAEPFIFHQGVIHEINVQLPPDSVSALGADPYEYVVGEAVIDGVVLEDVGVRLRGKIGSFRELSGKPKFKIDFNAFVDGRRFQGLESLSLNNSVVDCSYLKEHLSYTVFRALDTPAARTSYARVTVNDADYGLYIIVETQDDRFLKAKWDDGSGNLYDGKYIWYGGRDYLLLDFGEGNDTEYQLEEGEDVGHADISGVSDALAAGWGEPDYYARLSEVIDWDEVHRVWAGEQWVGQNDGYCMNKNNYRVYFDPEDGKADLIPWDMDYSFLRDSDWGRDWNSPYGNLARGCFADPTCSEAHRAVVADMLDTVDALGLQEQMDDLLAVAEDAMVDDPRRECYRSDIPAWHDYVAWWLDNRSDRVEAHWGL